MADRISERACGRWNGDSRGHWDGNTLVVETTNFSDKSYFMGATDHLTVVRTLHARRPRHD
jgi:hypothetical protein